ncbi:MAG: heme utilization cystosolic carrier protein HutX [Bradyrhizobiaceae bacterium]|nr:MAG: heme utilization cystosolic carrier protein HutX [Bradyrhizobiaceae bacterium]
MLSTDLADLRKYMAENPGAVIEDVAREKNVTARVVLEALPEEMRRFAPGTGFVPAMQEIATWGEVTLIVHTDDGIFEITDPVSNGEIGRGYFNLSKPKGLHGHLRHERCAAIAFVERPFVGKSSAFVAFVNADGGIMFKVFVGRDEQRQLKTDQLEKFRALANNI